MKKMTSEFAEIIGLLCAEGSYVLAYSAIGQIIEERGYSAGIINQRELNFATKTLIS